MGTSDAASKRSRSGARKPTMQVNLWKPLAYLVLLALSPVVLLVDCLRRGKRVGNEWLFAFVLFMTLALLFTGVCLLISENHNNQVFALLSRFTDTGQYVGEKLQYSEEITYYALKSNIDPLLLYAVMDQESRGEQLAFSNRKARGLMQIMPATWREMNPNSQCNGEHGRFVCKPDDCIFDARANISTGARYLSRLIRHFDGQVNYALEAYNAGSSTVDTAEDDHAFAETRGFTRGVADRLKRFREDRVMTSVRLAQNAREALKVSALTVAGMWFVLMFWLVSKLDRPTGRTKD